MSVPGDIAKGLTSGLVSPITKLIEVTADAIGTVYEPHKVKKLADAHAYEIEAYSKAVKENPDLKISIESPDGIKIDPVGIQPLFQRAGQRVIYREITRQQNIENVVRKTANEFADNEKVSNTPVDADWASRFFEYAANVSNDELQLLWAKILAGEIRRPQSCSLRTLVVLRDLSRDEAKAFVNLSPYFLYTGDDIMLYNNEDLFKKYGVLFADVLLLFDAGMLISMSTLGYNQPIDKNEHVLFHSESLACIVSAKEDCSKSINFPAYKATEAGKELYEITNHEADRDFFFDIVDDYSSKYKDLNFGSERLIEFFPGGLVHSSGIQESR
jgi:hypothetical protein